MPNISSLHEILYVSQLAADAPLRVVADIAARSRVANQSRDITGLLVFDGMRFCQQFEGSRIEVAALMDAFARTRATPKLKCCTMGRWPSAGSGAGAWPTRWWTMSRRLSV